MKRVLAIAALTLGVMAVGGFLFAWSGIYNIGASDGHWPAVRWFLTFSMRNSVETHSIGIDAPALDDTKLVLQGAGHYQGACAPCHGAPGVERDRVAEQMLPEPPFLPDHVTDWETDELFWIVKNGLKYTGMPAWAAQGRDDEVWAVVAFLLRLPNMEAGEYQILTRGEAVAAAREAEENERLLTLTGPIGTSVAACARCHGFDGTGRANGAFPRLPGQTELYLFEALKSYKSGARPSGFMQPVVAELTESEMRRLAAYYSGQAGAPFAKPAAPDTDLLALGRRIAESGVPAEGIPGCVNCHGPANWPRNPRYPVLAGQFSDYIESQLKLWRSGIRGNTAYARIMEAAAGNLTDEQIRAVAAYYASLRPGDADGGAAEATDGVWPAGGNGG